jgi:hypothetical protein
MQPRRLGKPNEGGYYGQQQYQEDHHQEGSNEPAMPQRETLQAMTLPSGAIYTGKWLNGMKDGFGMQRWPDGSKYEGEWQ